MRKLASCVMSACVCLFCVDRSRLCILVPTLSHDATREIASRHPNMRQYSVCVCMFVFAWSGRKRGKGGRDSCLDFEHLFYVAHCIRDLKVPSFRSLSGVSDLVGESNCVGHARLNSPRDSLLTSFGAYSPSHGSHF